MKKVGRGGDYSPDRLKTIFLDSIMDDEFREVTREGARKKWDLKELQKNLLALELHIEVKKQQEQIRNRRTLDSAPALKVIKIILVLNHKFLLVPQVLQLLESLLRTSRTLISTGKYFQIKIKMILRNKKQRINLRHGSKRTKKG